MTSPTNCHSEEQRDEESRSWENKPPGQKMNYCAASLIDNPSQSL